MLVITKVDLHFKTLVFLQSTKFMGILHVYSFSSREQRPRLLSLILRVVKLELTRFIRKKCKRVCHNRLLLVPFAFLRVLANSLTKINL